MVSSAHLEPDIVRYVERYASCLQLESPRRLLPSGKPDYGSGSIVVPKRLISTPDAHQALGEDRRQDFDGPPWTRVLVRYRAAEAGGDSRTHRVPVQRVPWCPAFGGALAIEVPVVDVWRIIASFNPHYVNYTNMPNTATEIHVADLWLSVPDAFRGLPLVRMTFRPEVAFAPLSRTVVPDAAFARAMCGGAGLAPDAACGRTVYASRAPGWDTVRVPLALGLAVVPAPNRCYFAEQHAWLAARAARMAAVAHFLWDHAEAADCTAEQVPVKVVWEEAAALFEAERGRGGVSPMLKYRLASLVAVAQGGLLAALREPGADDSAWVEIEDAVELLDKADTYEEADRVFWDDEGVNQIVDDWWGRFGPDRARWVALDMTIKLLLNMADALVFHESFSSLLHAGTGNCFIV